jgi:hypothetical protein
MSSHKKPAVLLIGCTAIGVFIVAWVIPADNTDPSSVALESHYGPPTQACLILLGLVLLDEFCQGSNCHQTRTSFLYLAKIFMDVVCYHQMDCRFATFE